MNNAFTAYNYHIVIKACPQRFKKKFETDRINSVPSFPISDIRKTIFIKLLNLYISKILLGNYRLQRQNYFRSAIVKLMNLFLRYISAIITGNSLAF